MVRGSWSLGFAFLSTLALLGPMGCCGGGTSDEPRTEDPSTSTPTLSEPELNALPGATASAEAPPADERPTSAVAFGPENAEGFEHSDVGFCTKLIRCKCPVVEGLTAEACAKKFTTEVLHGKPMAKELWPCFLQMSCADLCADNTSSAQACVKQVVAASKTRNPGGSSNHDTAMKIIENMGSTCPPGTNKVNGSCVPY